MDPNILIAIAIPTGGGLIAWGTLRQKVNDLDSDVATKASKEVVEAHFEAVLERLERIERKIDRNGHT